MWFGTLLCFSYFNANFSVITNALEKSKQKGLDKANQITCLVNDGQVDVFIWVIHFGSGFSKMKSLYHNKRKPSRGCNMLSLTKKRPDHYGFMHMHVSTKPVRSVCSTESGCSRWDIEDYAVLASWGSISKNWLKYLKKLTFEKYLKKKGISVEF